MSSPLAIGAVSAVLRNLLDNGVIEGLGPTLGTTVKVTALPPDAIDLEDAEAPPQLNLFLHGVSPSAGLRNERLASRDAGGNRLTNPPLALDLHYLLTAYGKLDLQAEILLGYGMYVLHERPILDRAAIRRALDPSPLDASVLPTAYQVLRASDLAEQLEAIKITPVSLDTEAMSRIWSAMQVHYRPTAAYRVSVVLIEASRPARAPLPVLSRGPVDLATGRDRGVVVQPDLTPPVPTLTAVAPPGEQPAARLGETLALRGFQLDGTAVSVRFAHRLLDAPRVVSLGANGDPHRLDVTLPADAGARSGWPAGVYAVTVALVRPGETVQRETNAAALLLAPDPTLPPAAITRDVTTGAVTVDLTLSPDVRPQQVASLVLGDAEVRADAHPTQTAHLRFVFPSLPPGERWVRLRVDGVDSPLLDRSTTPPRFLPAQKLTVPA